MDWIWVALGSALGGLARYGATEWIARSWPGGFPFGTMAVNAAGSLVMGFLGAFAIPGGHLLIGEPGKQFLMVGILGGFTTFSAFSHQTLILLRNGEWALALANMAGSVVLCVGLAALGFWFASLLNRP